MSDNPVKRRSRFEDVYDESRAPKSTLPAEVAKDPFVKPNEIAKHLKVDQKTVIRWCKSGKFGSAPDVIQLFGGQRRIRTSAYERAMNEANK